MSATDELRKMLDERGVEWGNVRNDGSESDYLTEWQLEDNQGKAIATEWAVGSGLSVEIHRYHLTPEQAIAATLGSEVNGDTSDGYHTFNELYYHRTALFACLVALQPRQMAFKSWKHSDGTMYEGFFIAGIYTSGGWCTYHCEAKWWPLFDCHEQEFAPEWDGHTPSDAIHRLMSDFLPSQDVSGEVSE